MSLYGNKFVETDLNKPVVAEDVDEYINKITKLQDKVDILPGKLEEDVKKKELIKYKFILDGYLNFLLINISKTKSIECIKELFSIASLSSLESNYMLSDSDKNKLDFFITNDFKNITLGELMDDTTELDTLINTYKYTQILIKFFNESNENCILISNELDNILNDYISNSIDEDEDYQHPNLYNHKNLQCSDINYLYKKYIKPTVVESDVKKQMQDYNTNCYVLSVIAGTLSIVSGYVLYNVL
jgi:hypothetical protein